LKVGQEFIRAFTCKYTMQSSTFLFKLTKWPKVSMNNCLSTDLCLGVGRNRHWFH